MEIFVGDTESGTGKWRSLLVHVNVCLLTSRPITERHFTFAPLGVVLKMYMYEDTKWHNLISNLKQFFG